MKKAPITTALKQALYMQNVDSHSRTVFSDKRKYGVAVKFAHLKITDEQIERVANLMEMWGYHKIAITRPSKNTYFPGVRFYYSMNEPTN